MEIITIQGGNYVCHYLCWRCNTMNSIREDGLCYKCQRTPDREHWEGIERAKAEVKGNPKTYGTSESYRHKIDLEAFAMTLLEKMCRG